MMNLETAKELNQSLLWAAVVEEIDKKITFEVSKLKTCSPEQLPLIQATVQVYERMKKLPDDIIERES